MPFLRTRLPGCLSWTLALLPLLLCAPLSAQKLYQDLDHIPLPDPELERATFVLPEGFAVNLFAADPAIAKPIQINFDPQGRLWIVSSEVYPHIEPGQKANDKVLVLEDLDGDGVSDKTHVFAQGLLIPTGVAPGDGGAYVGASTELLHFKDDDGDLKADRVDVLLSGFGTEDTHHILHTFRWGPEQRLYFNQSIYIHSHIETPWGVERLNAGGVWRFRPETLRLNVFARGWVNSWGCDFTDNGATFVTDGAGGEGINYVVPGASYTTAFGAARILSGLNPGSPKHCGLEIVSSEQLPDDWRESCITSDFRGHRVCRFTLREDGAGFLAQEQQEVIRSDHPAFRPIDAKLGPDGAIYVADWYNPVIQHGEVDFRDERRDHTHGRIWRVTYTGKPLVPRPQLAGRETPQLVAQLESPNVWNRRQAQRLLKERGPDVLKDVDQWLQQLNAKQANYEQLRLEGLWMHLAFESVNRELLTSLLRCDDSGVRAAACRVLGDWQGEIDNPLDVLAERVRDANPRVRLEAVRALAEVKDPQSVVIAMRALDPPPTGGKTFTVDRWLDYALWLTARDLQPVWEPALAAGKIDFDGNVKHLVFALKSAGSTAAAPVLLDLLGRGKVSSGDVGDVLDVISAFGGPQDLQRLVQLAAASRDDAATVQYLDALATAQSTRKIQPAGGREELIARAKGSSQVTAAVSRLVGLWQWPEGLNWLSGLARETKQPLEIRVAAVEGLASFGGPESKQQLLAVLSRANEPAVLRRAAIIGLVPDAPQEAARRGVAHLRSAGDADGVAPLIEAFLSRPNITDRLTEALTTADGKGETLPADVALAALRVVRASGRPAPQLEAALAAAGGVSAEPRLLSAEELATLAALVATSGDPHRGEEVFRRAELQCFKCHSIGDAGGIVGPNLLSLGATAQVDYLLESLANPNAKLKEGYHTVVIVDTDGKQWAGIKLRQTDAAVVLRNADGQELSIPLAKVEVEAPGVSLMPAGLTEKLSQQELLDLTAFLAALGKHPGFTIGSQQIARRWQTMEATPDAAYQLRRISYAQAASDDPAFHWRTIYSTVSGDLPLEELPDVTVKNRSAPGNRGVSFVRCEVDVQQPGAVLLLPNSAVGLQAWIDGDPFEIGAGASTPLTQGKHRLTIGVDRTVLDSPSRPSTLRLELKLPPESTAAAKFVGGL